MTAGTLYDEAIRLGFGKLLASQVINNVASAAFTTQINDTYDTYLIDMINLTPSVDGRIYARVSFNNGSTWIAANYLWAHIANWSATAPNGNTYNSNSEPATGSTWFQLTRNVPPSGAVSGELILSRSAGFVSHWHWSTSHDHATNVQHFVRGGGVLWDGAGLVNAVQFLPPSGILVSGRLNMYGLRKG